jgi:UDP-glucose 4-epimerase
MLVVTGASGFLGRTILRRAVAKGLPVTAVSRKPASVGDVPAIRLNDYSELEPPSMNATLIHLAEEADIAAAEPQGESRVARGRDTFAALAARGWRHVVYASSGVVYGDREAHARREDEAIEPETHYARGKLACEEIALGAGGTALRLGNLYGDGMSKRVVMSDIVAQIGQSGPLRVRDASPVRDFIHVEDAADGFLTAAERKRTGVYNIASGTGTSVGYLARIVLSIAGENERAVTETQPGGRFSHLTLDIGRIGTETGWRPAISLEIGLRRLVGGVQ